jgi:Protein of unknown function (DUF2845)
MQRRWLALVVLIAVVLGTGEIASALQCGGRVVSVGDNPWEVKEVCGEPTHIEDSLEVIPQLVYDEFRHTYVHLPVYVNKSLWVYNFGPTRLMYLLTFREQKLVKIETGGYGR